MGMYCWRSCESGGGRKCGLRGVDLMFCLCLSCLFSLIACAYVLLISVRAAVYCSLYFIQFLYVGACDSLQLEHCLAICVQSVCAWAPAQNLQVWNLCVHVCAVCPYLKHLKHCVMTGFGGGRDVRCLLYVNIVMIGMICRKCFSSVVTLTALDGMRVLGFPGVGRVSL